MPLRRGVAPQQPEILKSRKVLSLPRFPLISAATESTNHLCKLIVIVLPSAFQEKLFPFRDDSSPIFENHRPISIRSRIDKSGTFVRSERPGQIQHIHRGRLKVRIPRVLNTEPKRPVLWTGLPLRGIPDFLFNRIQELIE